MGQVRGLSVSASFPKGTPERRASAMNETHDQSEASALESLSSYLSKPWILVLSLAIVTFLVYSGTLAFEFVWDDGPQIVNNPIIRTWANLPRAFGSDLWYHVARHQVYYRPLFVAWSMLNYMLIGLRPWGWHLGAVLVHIGAVASVFWLAWKLTREYWTAALAGLIFALHPIHVEVVAWVSAASDSMVAMFTALAFVAFLNGKDSTKQNRTAWQVASLALLLCALLTKEMAISFTALVAIYVWLRPTDGKASVWQRTWEAAVAAIPYAVVTVAYAGLRMRALAHSPAQFDVQHGMVDMVRTLPLVLAFYLEKLVVPVGLTGLYYMTYVTAQTFSQIILPFLILGCVVATLLYWNRQEGNATVAFAGIWMLVGLVPALYLRNFDNGSLVHDRYIYLPSIGFAILLAIGLRRLPGIHSWHATCIQAVAVTGLCLFYAGASIWQQTYWASNLLLAVRGEQLCPENPQAKVLLSTEYSQRGANDRAIELATAAVQDHPEYVYGMLALAEADIRAQHFEEGGMWLDRFVSASPEFAQSLTGMASLAGLYGRMKNFQHATELCDRLLAKEPNLYSAVYNCGNIQLMAGKYAEAERLLSRAVSLEPLQAAPKHFLGRTLFEDGRNREAQAYLQAAVVMDPTVWDYHYWLGKSLELTGNTAGARNEYRQALQLNRDSAETKLRLAALEAK